MIKDKVGILIARFKEAVFKDKENEYGPYDQIFQYNRLRVRQEDGSLENINAEGSGGLSAPVDAADIADGSVSNAEFERINTLSSNAQTQLNTKVDTAANSGASGAAVLKTISGTTVTARKVKAGTHTAVTEETDDVLIDGDGDADKIKGYTVVISSPTDGQAIKYDSASGHFINAASSFGGDSTHAGFSIIEDHADTVAIATDYIAVTEDHNDTVAIATDYIAITMGHGESITLV